jgi:host factor-I protein
LSDFNYLKKIDKQTKKPKEREAIREMDNNAQNSQNVQDGFLNNLRKDRVNVTIYLMGGVKLTGKIRSFDKFSLVLESGNLEQLIFKHAISTISVPRGSFHHSRPEGRVDTRSEGQQQQSHQSPPPPPSGPSTPTSGSSSATSGS